MRYELVPVRQPLGLTVVCALEIQIAADAQAQASAHIHTSNRHDLISLSLTLQESCRGITRCVLANLANSRYRQIVKLRRVELALIFFPVDNKHRKHENEIKVLVKDI